MGHEGHRDRLRTKFTNSPASLEDHELLELLLYYSLPRVNTNEQGHRLIEQFDSIKGVLDADTTSLEQTQGIGPSSAFLIRVIAELTYRYVNDSSIKQKWPVEDPIEAPRFVCPLFTGAKTEKMYIILLDNSNNIIGKHLLSEGTTNATAIPMQRIAQLVNIPSVAKVVLAHNHPGGKLIPSGEDLFVTNRLSIFFKILGIPFIDHYIVVDNDCIAIKNTAESFAHSEVFY